jgi:hypothetical protein
VQERGGGGSIKEKENKKERERKSMREGEKKGGGECERRGMRNIQRATKVGLRENSTG